MLTLPTLHCLLGSYHYLDRKELTKLWGKAVHSNTSEWVNLATVMTDGSRKRCIMYVVDT